MHNKEHALTVTVQIGNSDDKLTQRQWAQFVQFTNSAINTLSSAVHFSGFSAANAEWQNAAWVFLIAPEKEDELRKSLTRVRRSFNQDSIGYTVGNTEFI